MVDGWLYLKIKIKTNFKDSVFIRLCRYLKCLEKKKLNGIHYFNNYIMCQIKIDKNKYYQNVKLLKD